MTICKNMLVSMIVILHRLQLTQIVVPQSISSQKRIPVLKTEFLKSSKIRRADARILVLENDNSLRTNVLVYELYSVYEQD